MASRFSVANGAWTSTTTWSHLDGGPPGAPAPVSGDYVYISHMVTANTNVAARRIYVRPSGDLIMNGNITLDDAVDAVVEVSNTATRLYADPATAGYSFRSASSNPTYPWRFIIQPTRTVNFGLHGIRFLGNAPVLRGTGIEYAFNAHPSTAGYLGITISHAGPKSKTPIFDYHRCSGRTAGGRTYRRGNDSARMTASGHFIDSAYTRYAMEALKHTSSPISFTSWNDHIVYGYVEDVRYRQPLGSRYVYFDLYLVEDL